MKLVAILAALLVVVGAAVSLGGAGDDPPSAGSRQRQVALGDVRLVSVESCEELEAWYEESARAVDPNALAGFGGMMAVEDSAMSGGARSAAGSGTAAGAAAPGAEAQETAATTAADTGGTGGDGFSGTNVQEESVDEPDTVKTNGDVIVQASYNGINVIDIGDGAPRLLSRVEVEQGGGTELLLDGDRVLALTNVWRERQAEPQRAASSGDRIGIMPIYGEPVVILTAIDISNPEDPQVVATSEVDGTYRSARVVGSTVRLVLTSTPQLPQPDPAIWSEGDQSKVDAALEEWREEAISAMTLEDWMPSIDGDQAVACNTVSHPAEPAGFATTTVITLDLNGELDRLDEDAVVADAGTIYASTDRLYVATSQWSQTFSPEGFATGSPTTDIHAFDITDAAATTYLGSGSVPGFLLNQFSMSEREGFLRIATTQQPPWDPSAAEQATSSSMAVLAERDGALAEVGRLDGLGATETIQAVRFLDDVAYVVTFRRTDPLFVIDLADPTNPSVLGELKVPGYSAYLHPIEEGRVLGVGQDANEEGVTLGTQVSTFDVSDAAAPDRIDNLTIEHASSAVEYDHRAFLWWGDTRTAVIPVEIYPAVQCNDRGECIEPSERPFMGAVAFGVDRDGGLDELGRVSHDGRGAQPDGWYPVTRTIVAGGALYTISEAGVLKSDLESFADLGFAQVPTPDFGDQPVAIEG